MSINLISVTYEWDYEKEKYVLTKKEVNPNLKQDVNDLMDGLKED